MWKSTILLCVLVSAAPGLSLLPDPLAVGATGLAASLALIGASLSLRPREAAFLRLAGTRFFLAAILPALWIGLQIVPLPPLAHPVWKQAADALQQSVAGTISIDIGASAQALLAYVAGLCIAVATAMIAIDARRARWLANAILVATLGACLLRVAALGLPQLRSDAILFIALTGVPIGIATILEAQAAGKAFPSHPTALGLPAAAAALGFVVLASFGGAAVMAGVAGAGLIAAVWVVKRSGIPFRAANAVVLCLVGLALCAGVALRPHPELPLSLSYAAAPEEVLQRSSDMVADRPLLGSGAGTIGALLPVYADNPASMPGVASAAAALSIQDGTLACAALVAAIVVAIAAFVSGAIDRRRDWSFAAAAAAYLVALGIVTFRLPDLVSVPGIVVAAASLGCAVSQRISRSRSGHG